MSDRPARTGKLAIGRLGAPRGVRGELRVHSYSGEFKHFLGLKEVDLVPGPGLAGASAPGGLDRTRDAAGAPRAAGPLRLKVLRIEEGAGSLGITFVGYESPEAARALTGMDIVADRAAAAPLGENEWYVADLVGLELSCAGLSVARVVSVLDGAADPCLEARLPDGRSALVPFRKEFVGEVDIEGGRIELLAPWLLEP